MPYKDGEKRVAYAKEYNQGWYQRHKDEVITRRKKRQLEIRNWFMRYKSALCCVDCGISHPAVLQFHHRNRLEKSFNISDVVRKANSLKQIMNEIKKCDVLCVNCHAKRHWRETHQWDSWEEMLSEE
jgi:hypothetical protein